MQNPVLALLLILGLSACSFASPFRSARTDAPEVTVTDNPGDEVIRPQARAIGDAALPPAPTPASDGFLGETLAGLGAPGETGLWLATGLVTQTRRGHIIAQDGRSLNVELRASGAEPGAGSQISLMAMQSLGLPLGQLATLRVYVD